MEPIWTALTNAPGNLRLAAELQFATADGVPPGLMERVVAGVSSLGGAYREYWATGALLQVNSAAAGDASTWDNLLVKLVQDCSDLALVVEVCSPAKGRALASRVLSAVRVLSTVQPQVPI